MTVLWIPNYSSHFDDHWIENLIILRPSWFVASEELSQWCDVPSFCEDLDFRLGHPDSSPQRICPSDAIFCLFVRILTSNSAVLICRPVGSVPVMQCSVFLRGSWLPIGLSSLQGSVERPISNNNRPFWNITYVTLWSKLNVHYALCRACKMYVVLLM